MTLSAYISDHGIRHFTPEGDHRILSPVEKGGRGLVEPCCSLWPNIIGTLECADEIREKLGAPVRVVSGYRTHEYNRLLGNKDDSEHVQFRALDLTWDGPIAELWMVGAEVMDHAHARGLRTGFGRYKTFVHLDTGSPKGTIRRWKGKGVP